MSGQGKIKPDFERYMTALRCEQPDRVPLGDWHVDRLPKEKFLGKKIATLQDEVEFWHRAGFDFVTASSGILEPVRAPEGMTTKGEAVHTEYGDRVSREWAQEHEGVIRDWESFEKFTWPTVDDFDLSKWDVFDKILPSGMKAVFLLGKIYTTVWMYMGAETFFNALRNNEELIGAMFEKVGRLQYETFLRVIEHPCVGAVLNPDDIAHNTGLLVDPKHLRKHLFPWYKKMGDVCRDKGLGFIFHSDGNCTEAMDDLVECGYHAFNPIQPNAMDIDAVKQKWGDKLCLIGNLNLDSTLTLGTVEDVRAEVYERIRTIAPGGGYMVASSNSVTDYVPLANMKAMFEATFEFGRYPINLPEGGATGTVWTYQAQPKQSRAKVESQVKVEEFVTALLNNNVPGLLEQVEQNLTAGIELTEVINQGMVVAMTVIGEKFQNGEIYIPEMMIAARSMSAALDHFKSRLGEKSEQKKGKVVIGTVKGDLHDIGKSLVAMILKGQGYLVEDLGVSVSPEQFVKAVQNNKPDVVALSALLTTTMIEMNNTIKALKDAGLRDGVKVIVGGAPVTQKFADQIGADGYAPDAAAAVELAKRLVQ